ncbi:MAG TPA: aminotransferase class V-fold PLP-dependent enzyme [Steroidobacteraceae bacterium]|nr:aminotransferase class V-fold PLP-dependent enzyme [Steroidobacteraceae bacterium]
MSQPSSGAHRVPAADFTALRREFPLLARKTYLNSGSYGVLANEVKAAFEAYLEDRSRVGADWDLWVGKHEAVRSRVGELLGASPEEIAVTASVSAGLNSLASALDFSGPRNKVVISDFEFPTVAQIWHAQERRGARIVHVARAADGYIPAAAFAAAIDEHTQLVSITHVCFRNGARLDVPGIVEIAHARGARVLLDCYQSVGSMSVDVKALGVDFAVGGMLKYLLGTAGIGFLYVREALVPSLVPTDSGWFAQENIGAMQIGANLPAASARRFEAGTPAVVNCYASEAGLNLLLRIGIEPVERRVRALTAHCLRRLEQIGWSSVTPPQDERRGATVAIPSRDATRLVRELKDRGIVTSSRDDNVRAAFHFYNDESDVQVLCAALEDLRASLAPWPR